MPREILDQEDLQLVAQSLDTLRRIRRAATLPEDVQQSSLERWFGRLTNNNQTPLENPEQALWDAKEIGLATSALAIDRLHGHPVLPARGQLEDILARRSQTYGSYQHATFLGLPNEQAAANIGHILTRLNHLPEHQLQFHFFQLNGFNFSGIAELLKSRVGVIAPLSSDYLVVQIYAEFLSRSYDGELNVEPAAIDEDLQGIVLPKNPLDGTPIFRWKKHVGLFQDIIESGETGRAFLAPLAKEYPRATLHHFDPDRDYTQVKAPPL